MNQRAEFTWKDTDGGLLVSVRGEIDHHTAAAIRTGMDALLFARRPARLVCASGIQARKYAAF